MPSRSRRKKRLPRIQHLDDRALLAADISFSESVDQSLTEVESSPAYFSRAVPSVAISGTQLLEPAGGTRPVVDSNDGFRIEIIPGLNVRNQFGALEAVERAARQWEAMLNDPITVTIHFDIAFDPGFLFDDIPASVLGFAEPVEVQLPYAQVRSAMQSDGLVEQDDSILASLPSPETIEFAYPGSLRFDNMIGLTKANLKSLGLHSEFIDEQTSVSDGLIVLNPEAAAPNDDHRFDYNSTDGIAPGNYDFESLVVHEIGHVLGFISAVDRIDQTDPASGIAIAPTTLDLFRFRSLAGTGNPRTAAAFENIQREMRPGIPAVMDFVMNDGWTTLENEYVLELGTDSPTGDFGYQASHWQEADLAGQTLGIMAPTLALQTIAPISNVDLRAFDLIGYDILPPGEPADAPVLNDDVATITTQRTIVIDPLANDQNNTRPLDLSTLRIVEAPAGGTVEFDPVTGFFVYNANPGFAGEDIFTYTVADDRGIFATPASVTIEVTGSGTNTNLGEAPIAVDDFVLTRQNQPIGLNPLANDRDNEETLSLSQVQVTVAPSSGSVVQEDDQLVYTPDTDFVGDDSFTYSVTDSDGNVSSAIVRVTVGNSLPPVVIPGDPLTLMQRSDVSRDNQVTAIDALMVINHLNRTQSNSPASEPVDQTLDVNGDQQVTALDALTIINLLNQQAEAVIGLPEAEDMDDEDENWLGGQLF